MTQTLTLVQPPLARDSIAAMRAMASAAPRNEATKACDVFFARTAAAGPASDDDHRAIIGSVIQIVSVGRNRPLPVSPIPSTNLQLIVEGWAYRAHTLADGARQITDILLPGDFYSLNVTASFASEHDVRAFEHAQVAVVRSDIVTGSELPSLRRRWEWVRDAEAHRLRSRLISLGRRDARQRVAHFMAEMHDRLRQVGLADDVVFTCPLTQKQLADVLGLTSVHVNRVLQRLRAECVVMFNRSRVVIPDLARLHAAAGLDGGPADV
jgi:CRP-like cAMP-binding protein